MDTKDINISTFNLLQPYLLSERELIEILTSRCIDKDLSSCTKDELVELFKRVALPLPQREYGTSQREKRLSQKQRRNSKIIIRTDDGNAKASTNCSVMKNTNIAETKISPVSRFQPAPERLRPPPDLVNYKRKIIKINESSKKMIRSELDKIIIINKKKETGCNAGSSSKIVTKTPSSVNGRLSVGRSVKTEVAPPATPSVIKLKRDSSIAQTEADTSSEVKTDVAPQKKKRQKIVISW